MLLIATVIPSVISLKNNVINATIPSIPLANIAGNWTEMQKLLASDGAAWDIFGNCVAIDGDTALIGAPWDDDNGADSGSVYVFTRTDTTWTQQAKLLASDGETGDNFGYSISLSGDTALIGAKTDDDNGLDSGSAYIFIRSDTTWTQQGKLLASDGAVEDYFGYSVSLSGDTALIGVPYDDIDDIDYGSAYVFTRTDTTWTQEAKLIASDGGWSDQFGNSVSISGDTALIGAHWDITNEFHAGSAYVFTRTGTTWTEQQKLFASDGSLDDTFGVSVSLDGDTALIGAFGDDDVGGESGSAYIFIRSDTTWTLQKKILASDGAPQHYFGVSVSLSGDTTLIGTYNNSAYVFTRTGTTWTQQQKLLASDNGDSFGQTISLDGGTALIGARYDDDLGSYSGSAYVFAKENQPPIADFTWTPQNPSNNQQVTFDASASQDPDGTITLYEWDWDNDGVYDEAQSSPTIIHSWATLGSYPVKLRVTDNDNTSGIITKTVDVSGITLEISIQGGIGVKAVITNNGTSDANDVPWQIHVQGGILKGINKAVDGTIDIPEGDSITVKTGLFFGFGAISITVKIADEEQTATGTQIIIFSMVK